MKKHLRNSFITFVSYTGLSLVYRTFKKSNGPLVRVIVFHDVGDADWFRNMIALMCERYNVLTPEAFLKEQFDPKRINVLITFDDGYASWVDVCLPILAEKNIKALFFINSGLIDSFGHADTQERYVREQLLLSPRKTLSWDGVWKLRDAGHTIGGHTTTHVRLTELQEEMGRREITHDKVRIEAMLRTPIVTFAYPFGQLSDFGTVAKQIVKEVGYTHAFTTEGVFAHTNDHFAISRLCIEDNLTVSELKCWIEGGYDLYHKFKTLCAR